MNNPRYKFAPKETSKLEDCLQAAISAMGVIAGRSLESLEGIPTRLHYLFEEIPGVPSPDSYAALQAEVERVRSGKTQSNQPAPTSPVDDEATVSTVARIIRDEADCHGAAHEVVAAIRRGEVPGLPSPDEHATLIQQRQRIFRKWQEATAERDAIERQRDRAVALMEKYLSGVDDIDDLIADIKKSAI